MRYAILALCFVLLVFQQPSPKLRFVQPVRALILSGPKGVWVPVQAYVPRHEQNRSVSISWHGIGCEGSAAKSMDGEYEASLFPLVPVKVEATYGLCHLRVTTYGPGGKVRESAELAVRVCGGEDEC